MKMKKVNFKVIVIKKLEVKKMNLKIIIVVQY